MARVVEYFFTLQSPWSYIGHATFTEVAARHDARIDYRPMNLGRIFPESGGLPLAKRHPARQAYRLVELQRWIAKRRLPMVMHPRFWPFDPTLADRVVTALAAAGGDAAAHIPRVLPRLFAGTFEREEDLADDRVVAAVLDEAGLDAAAIIASAREDVIGEVYAENAAMALARGAIGAPTYCLDGEVFWGQDRLELLDDALASGRAPFTPTP